MASFRPLPAAVVSACLLIGLAACSGGDDAAPSTGPTPVPPDAYILYRDSTASIIARHLVTNEIFDYPVEIDTGAVIATACSSDGSRIALLRQPFDITDRQLLVSGRDAPTEPITLPPAVQGIEWSPGGTHVVYTEFDGFANKYTISILDLATTEITQLTSGEGVAGSPSWSPDGSTIAYSIQDVRATESSVYLLDATAGGPPARLNPPDNMLYYDPEWTPDGSALLVAGQSETDIQLYRVELDGGNPEKITSSDVYKRLPRYSPDGGTIAYTGSIIPKSESQLATALHQFGIFLLDADGGNERALTADPRLNPGAAVDPYLDAFLMGWCLPGPWLDDNWLVVEETPAL